MTTTYKQYRIAVRPDIAHSMSADAAAACNRSLDDAGSTDERSAREEIASCHPALLADLVIVREIVTVADDGEVEIDADADDEEPDPEEALAAALDEEGINILRCDVVEYGTLASVEGAYSAPDDSTPVAIRWGWVVDDGNAEVRYRYASSGREAAELYVDGGDWGDRSETSWIGVYAWQIGYMIDADGDLVILEIGREQHTIELPAEEPDCEEGHDHDWRSPHSVLGGLAENPGVSGHGGGVIIREVCAHCGRYRITDTWAQDRSTGEQGLRSVSYEEADAASLAWVEGG